MVSEVRKVLDSFRYFESASWWSEIDAAERADAAKLEFFRSVNQAAIDGPVQELRRKVAEFSENWHGKIIMPSVASRVVGELLAELNAIIATKPDPVENWQATASGPVQGEWPPNWVTVQKIREIAGTVVREAIADAFRKHAEMLRNMPGAGHAAAVASVSDAIGKACEADRKERGS